MKMLMTNPIVLHVPLKAMYDNFLYAMGDMIWDDVGLIKNNDFLGNLTTLANGDFDGIRSMFQDGTTALLLNGEQMTQLESANNGAADCDGAEIRVYGKDGKCLGVILNSQINF